VCPLRRRLGTVSLTGDHHGRSLSAEQQRIISDFARASRDKLTDSPALVAEAEATEEAGEDSAGEDAAASGTGGERRRRGGRKSRGVLGRLKDLLDPEDGAKAQPDPDKRA
jgi:hypothetical protein